MFAGLLYVGVLGLLVAWCLLVWVGDLVVGVGFCVVGCLRIVLCFLFGGGVDLLLGYVVLVVHRFCAGFMVCLFSLVLV